MSDSKRRPSRVQGGWALTSSGGSRQQAVVTYSSCPHPLFRPKFVETKVDREIPPDIMYEGLYDLTQKPDKKPCRIAFYPDFVTDEHERRQMFDTLRRCVPWQEKSCLINGERIRMPRLIAWYGPMSYQFSGATLPPDEEWPPLVRSLHDRIRDETGYEFNSVLMNLYRNGKDSVAWHSDDELLFGIHPVIASLSFGGTRVFELREKASEGNFEHSEHVKIPLNDGSLLIMEGKTQTYWQHRIPKELHDHKARINLTFRTVFKKD